MRTMTVTIPDTIPIVRFIQMMTSLGLSVSFDGYGSITAMPAEPEPNKVVRIPTRPLRRMAKPNTDGPEAA